MASALERIVADAFARRTAPVLGLADDTRALALACLDMATRFSRGAGCWCSATGRGLPTRSRDRGHGRGGHSG